MATLLPWALRLAALLANVAPVAATRIHRSSLGTETRSIARASRLQREVSLMKERGAEVMGVLRSATEQLDAALLELPAAGAANGSAPPALRAAAAANQAPAGNASQTGLSTNTSVTLQKAPAGNARQTGLSTNTSATLQKEKDTLKSLFAHLKLSIARSNKGEEESKSKNKETIERLKLRLEKDRAKANDTRLSAKDREMYANETRMEERELQYWNRGRELQHGMYHANLKMTHGLMSRVKTVMEAYEEVLTKGHLAPELAKALHAAASSASSLARPPSTGASPPEAPPRNASSPVNASFRVAPQPGAPPVKNASKLTS